MINEYYWQLIETCICVAGQQSVCFVSDMGYVLNGSYSRLSYHADSIGRWDSSIDWSLKSIYELKYELPIN